MAGIPAGDCPDRVARLGVGVSMDQKTIDEHDKQCREKKLKSGDGPWQAEPNRAQWKHAGLDCLAVRHPGGLHWCGYVGVPPGHAAHGKDYDGDGLNVDVHGGLTYAAGCGGSVCHIPEAGEPDDLWWLGFDCAHWGDIPPGHEEMYERAGIEKRKYGRMETYKELPYVQAEVNNLAEQLAGGKTE